MSQEQTITWIIVAVVVVVIVGLGWWYFSQPATPTYTSTTTTQTKSSEKSITAFTFEGLPTTVQATINENDGTITATLPKNVDIKSLVPTVVVSDYATVSPASGSIQDFTNPVTYTVTAEDGSTKQYRVTVALSAT